VTTPAGDHPVTPRPLAAPARTPAPRSVAPLRVAAAAVAAVFTVRGAAPPLFEAMRPELWLVPDRRLGLSVALYALAALAAAVALAGRRAHRGAPPPSSRAVGIALLALGATSLLCAAARGPMTLLAARTVAGAAAGVVLALATGIVAAAGPVTARTAALLATSAPAGLAAGAIGAGLAQRFPSWRAAFVLAAGVALAAAIAALRAARAGPPPGTGAAAGAVPLRLGAAIARLRDHPSRRLAVAGATAWALAASALAAWLPAFLERSRGMPRALASGGVGVLAVLVGFAGLWAGARLARALAPRTPAPEAWAAAATCGGAGLLALGVVTAWRPGLYLPALLGALLLVTAAAGPIAAAVRAAIPEPERSALLPVALLVALTLGDALAPLLVGALSDRLGSLGRAMFLVPVALLVAAAQLALAARAAARAQRADSASS
jgi:MFS transporter, Spinster family, sphingosine-1-phosphate transporter